MSPAHAAWCTAPALCDNGNECWHHPDDLDLPASYETARAASYGHGPAYVGLAMGRALDSEAVLGLLPETDTCLVSLGIGRNGRGADETIELTIAEARELARRLNELCDLADVDARSVHGAAS